MPLETKINGRYIVKAKLGGGGMAVVYRAYDPPPMDRDVAVKTIVESTDHLSLQLLYQECELLKSLSHPNIVDIFDMGEFEDSGAKKPFWVMPLLPGQPLDELIRNASHRLTVERVVEIMTQTCRGLHAAHERGLVHGDLKPSNIFVMEDDSVKIVDFGVAHVVDSCSQSSGFRKGALLYMAPEQIQFKPASPQSDIFSLGVVCYEALTRRQPFLCPREEDGIQAVLKLIPPPASEINPSVTEVMSRVVQKAMAKQPWQRFSSAREFGQVLQQAFRNQPIELLDPERIRPRLERAQKAFDSRDYQFANEILSELEAEGNLNSAMAVLKANIERAMREKAISQLLDSAKAYFEKNEDPLALQKIRQVLELDANHAAALGLRNTIENRRGEREIESWIQLVERYVANHAFAPAREALESLLRIRPMDARASKLLLEVETSEQEYLKLRAEKAQTYQNALNYWRNGEVSQALSQMALVLELDRRAPDSSSAEEGQTYQSFYNTVRSAHDALNDAYAEACRQIARKRARLRNLEGAKSIAVQASGAPTEERKSIRERTPAFVVRRPPEAEFPSMAAEVDGITEAPAARTPRKQELTRPGKPWVRVAIPQGLWVASALLVLAVVLLTAPPSRSIPPAIVLVPVEFQVSPARATVKIDGKPQETSQFVSLPVGHHQVEASLDGYESGSTTISVTPGATPPVDLMLRPLAQDFRITTLDLKGAEVFLDDHSLGSLKAGKFSHAWLTLGQHNIRIQFRRAQKQLAGFSFESKPDRPPKVELPVEAGLSRLLVISSNGNSGFIAGTMSLASIKLDGSALGTLTDRGLALTNLQPGNHQLILGEGARARSMSFESGSSPLLNAVIFSERDEGDQNHTQSQAASGTGRGSFSTTRPPVRTKEAVSTARFRTQKPIPAGRVSSRAPARSEAYRPGSGFEAVITSSDPVVLRDFLSRNPSGEYHDRVAERWDDLVWANTETNDVASLNTYVSRFPGGRHADQARTQIAALTRASVPNADKPKVEPTIPAAVDDRSAVLKLVRQYQQAYQNESVDQLKVLWPNLGEPQIRALTDFFGHAQLVELDCKLIGSPIIAGSHSTLKVTQTLTYIAHTNNHMVSSKTRLVMHLRKQLSDSGRSDWRIESIE